MTLMTSREFSRGIVRAKREAKRAPVVITEDGRPAHVLMNYEDYQRLKLRGPTLADLLRDDAAGDFDFDPPRFNGIDPRTVDLD